MMFVIEKPFFSILCLFVSVVFYIIFNSRFFKNLKFFYYFLCLHFITNKKKKNDFKGEKSQNLPLSLYNYFQELQILKLIHFLMQMFK